MALNSSFYVLNTLENISTGQSGSYRFKPKLGSTEPITLAATFIHVAIHKWVYPCNKVILIFKCWQDSSTQMWPNLFNQPVCAMSDIGSFPIRARQSLLLKKYILTPKLNNSNLKIHPFHFPARKWAVKILIGLIKKQNKQTHFTHRL